MTYNIMCFLAVMDGIVGISQIADVILFLRILEIVSSESRSLNFLSVRSIGYMQVYSYRKIHILNILRVSVVH